LGDGREGCGQCDDEQRVDASQHIIWVDSVTKLYYQRLIMWHHKISAANREDNLNYIGVIPSSGRLMGSGNKK